VSFFLSCELYARAGFVVLRSSLCYGLRCATVFVVLQSSLCYGPKAGQFGQVSKATPLLALHLCRPWRLLPLPRRWRAARQSRRLLVLICHFDKGRHPFSSAYHSPATAILQRLPFSSDYHSLAPTILQRLPFSSYHSPATLCTFFLQKKRVGTRKALAPEKC
jgi:hypothetical protein